MGEFDDVIAEFLIESREGLDQLDRDLVELEERPSDKDLLSRIFRNFHTIKGTSGFLGFSKLEQLTHAGENLLSKLRDGELASNATITSALLESLDSVRYMLGEVEAGGNDGDGDYTVMTERLRALCRGEDIEAASDPSADAASAGAEPAHPASPPPPPESPADATAPDGELRLDLSEPDRMGTIGLTRSAAPASIPLQANAAGAPALNLGVREALGEALGELLAAAPAAAARGDGEHRPAAAESVRVDVHLLDKLVDLAGELVLTRNHIVQLAKGREDNALSSATQRLNFVTAQLQDGIMRMRMQPVSTLFAKFPRVVRDLARTCRKAVRLDLDGRDTELDKSLIEAIKDPLTHLLRNCVDHGVELPEVRQARGKDPEGRIVLRAYHQNGLVHIEVADDGGGIALKKVRSKAIARGLLNEERAQSMTDSEIAGLIFLPGFSTAEHVTNVSGRGVGMDVVKTNVEQVGGTVEVHTREGTGTTFTLKIPLTLAIVPALIVRCGGNRYALPQVNVIELVRIGQGHDHQELEWVHGAPVYRLRGKLLPLVFLEEALGGHVVHRLQRPANDNSDDDAPARFMAVVQASGRQFGLLVDAVLDQQEIVVKPLPKLLSGTGAFAGATLLGDGRVALILDILGIATRAQLVSETREDTLIERSHLHVDNDTARTLLVLRGANDSRLAVPLDQVSRLETIDPSRVESGGIHDVVQYRGDIMPLITPSDLLPMARSRMRMTEPDLPPPGGHLSVVVIAVLGRPLGLVVEDVLDVVEAPGELRRFGCRTGVVGTLVVQERVTEVLDLQWIGAAALGAA